VLVSSHIPLEIGEVSLEVEMKVQVSLGGLVMVLPPIPSHVSVCFTRIWVSVAPSAIG